MRNIELEKKALMQSLLNRMINNETVYIDSVTYNYHAQKQFGNFEVKPEENKIGVTIQCIHKDQYVDLLFNNGEHNYILIGVSIDLIRFN